MICPFMSTDPVDDMKTCSTYCALHYKNNCAINIIAQALYKQTQVMVSNQEKAPVQNASASMGKSSDQ